MAKSWNNVLSSSSMFEIGLARDAGTRLGKGGVYVRIGPIFNTFSSVGKDVGSRTEGVRRGVGSKAIGKGGRSVGLRVARDCIDFSPVGTDVIAKAGGSVGLRIARGGIEFSSRTEGVRSGVGCKTGGLTVGVVMVELHCTTFSSRKP